ncbi:MAG: rRNA methyltransferase, partial [Frankiales bacterium]|nr:rRNA methyltransferase [Frankiales bacterium]
QLELCTASDRLRSESVSKRQGARYRAARDVQWGDPWGPAGVGAAEPVE